MLSTRRRFGKPPQTRASTSRALAFLLAVAGFGLLGCGGSDATGPSNTAKLASITIDTVTFAIERGTSVTLRATAHDTSGKVDSIPVVWHSTVDSVATFGRDGLMTAGDTGVAIITASALGVTSTAIGVHVVWASAAGIAVSAWTPPNAVTPGAVVQDSVRALVTNIIGGPAVGALVKFSVTAGGGAVSPAYAKVTPTGIVSTQWTLGPAAGVNTVTVAVVKADSATVIPWVSNNPVTFTLKSYAALVVVQGDAQTANILSPLPTAPSVKLVDSLGKPRPGVPITFTPTLNGRVANPVVSTGVDGVASPGIWTLGDVPGNQQLIVTVESAKLLMNATATGTAVHFQANQVVTSQNATCALTADQFVSCLGRAPQNGVGDQANHSAPTLTGGSVHFTAIAGAVSGSHFCGTGTDLSIYCWGLAALVDTTGAIINDSVPARLPGNIGWLQVTPGEQHNCGLASDHTAYCWGIDASGQLGDNQTALRFTPAPVAGGFKFTSLTAGGSHECGITLDGAVFCWGSNASGQLGDGTTTNRGTPTAVSFPGAAAIQTVVAGQSWTCALDAAGQSYCWGGGTGNVVPTAYAAAPTFASLSVGAGHACGLTNDGTAYCWGDNSGGQLGDSTTTTRLTPTAVATTLKFKSISAGFQHTCGITSDGSLACWGLNSFGEIGVAPPSLQLIPRYIILGVTP